MKVLLTGGKGLLGRTLCAEWRKHEVIPAGHADVDITDAAAFDAYLASCRPDVVVHCAAMTAVDACETRRDEAFRVNALGTTNVAASCGRRGVRLVAISTDYVFDGGAARPYHEFDVPTGGANVYGQSKLAGERGILAHCPNHVIARVSWLYGPGGSSFVHTMLRLADGSSPELKVVCDQIGNPTSTFAVAQALGNIVERPELAGVFHLTCEGEASWCDFAREIFALAGKSQRVAACSSAEYKTPARRPLNSRLEKRMLRLCGLPAMPDWHDALREFFEREFPNGC